MSDDGLIEFEERHAEELADAFIKKHITEWTAFVYDEWINYNASVGDFLADCEKDRRAEEEAEE